MEPVFLTILMPCLDEARTLASCIRKAQTYLSRSGVTGETGDKFSLPIARAKGIASWASGSQRAKPATSNVNVLTG